MQNQDELSRTLATLQQETERATRELQTKKSEVLKNQTEIHTLTTELAQLQKELDVKKMALQRLNQTMPKLIQDEKHLADEERKHHTQLELIKNTYAKSLKGSGVKLY